MIQFKRMSRVGVCVVLLSATSTLVACDDGEWPGNPNAAGASGRRATDIDIFAGSGAAGASGSGGAAGHGGDAGSAGLNNAGNGGGDPTSGGAAGAGGSDAGGSNAGGEGGSNPTVVRSLNEVRYQSSAPAAEECTDDKLGALVVYPKKVRPDSEETRPAVTACVTGKNGQEWTVQAVRTYEQAGVPVDGTWVGFLYRQTGTDGRVITFLANEGKTAFVTLSCRSDGFTAQQDDVARGDASAPETTVCLDRLLDEPPFASIGAFKARLIGNAPTLTFYPVDGGAPLPITLFRL